MLWQLNFDIIITIITYRNYLPVSLIDVRHNTFKAGPGRFLRIRTILFPLPMEDD